MKPEPPITSKRMPGAYSSSGFSREQKEETMTRPVLNARMEKLFEVLRRIEEQQLRLTARDLEQMVVAEANYKAETWSTYRSKYLDGTLIFPDDADQTLLRIRGAVAMAPEHFAELLTQTKTRAALPEIDTEDQWRDRMRSLAALGRDRKYMLPPEDKELFLGLFGKQRSLF